MASPTVPKFPASPDIPGPPSVHEATARLWRDLGEAHQAMAQAYRTWATHLLATTTPDPDDDHWVTAKVVAQRLGVSPGHVYAQADTYPFTHRIGRLVRFSARGLTQYLTENGRATDTEKDKERR